MASFGTRLFQLARNHRTLIVGLSGLAVILVGASSSAEPPYSRPWSTPYGVSLEDENGSTLRSFGRSGETFVLGHMGERYRVRISNYADERVEAVLSIDGRDAISGRVGDYSEQRGYVVPAHGSVVVDGFRQSLDQVAKFRFSDPSSSYSSRMGTPENVGVIGVAFFRERSWPRRAFAVPREDPWDTARGSGRDSYQAPKRRAPSGTSPSPSAPKSGEGSAPYREDRAPARKRSTASDEMGASGSSRREAPWRRDYYDDDERSRNRLGTEYGESGWSPVSEVPFQRRNAGHPDSVVTLRYDDAEGLRARGIDVYPRPYWGTYATPEPFPGSRFAPPPP
jgi:hypothetical protein